MSLITKREKDQYTTMGRKTIPMQAKLFESVAQTTYSVRTISSYQKIRGKLPPTKMIKRRGDGTSISAQALSSLKMWPTTKFMRVTKAVHLSHLFFNCQGTKPSFLKASTIIMESHSNHKFRQPFFPAKSSLTIHFLLKLWEPFWQLNWLRIRCSWIRQACIMFILYTNWTLIECYPCMGFYKKQNYTIKNVILLS